MHGDAPGGSGLWIGELVATGERVVVDPRGADGRTSAVLVFRVAAGQPMEMLAARIEGRIRAVAPLDDAGGAVEAYQRWRETQARRAARVVPAARRGAAPSLRDLPAFTLPEAVLDADLVRFTGIFPAGFQDDLFLSQERAYKLRANARIAEELPPAALASMDEDEAVARMRRAIRSTDNLMHSTEHAAVDAALSQPGPHRRRLLDAYVRVVEGDAVEEPAFTAWADAVEALPRTGKSAAFRWPVACALPFLARPELHMMLKPVNAQETARRYRFTLRYAAQPNFATYRRWLDLVAELEARLLPLGARDRLDVQSFIWRVQG